MTIVVELFGIPRQRCGTGRVTIETEQTSMSLVDLLRHLGESYPEFARDCLDGSRLKPQYLANLGGSRFVSDPFCQVGPGDHVLIMSADAGG